MDRSEASPPPIVFETERLLLRPWQVTDAEFHRQLWEERDPRVPAHRRITRDGRPTVAELANWARSYELKPAPGLLVVQQKGVSAAIGYCGLIPNSVSRPEEPELAFEFLRAFWNQGFATEASREIIERARRIGYRHLTSTVRDWNTASLRVLDKLGFVNKGEKENDDQHGDSLLLRMAL
ncbi:GNAT family N-acetyltransferase [Rhodoglobus sp.]